jgi:PAS domain S-box-containing protein
MYFENIVQLSDDAIVSIDATQRVRLFNRGAERVFGYLAAEVIGQPLDMLLPPWLRAVHRQHVEHFAGSVDTLRPMDDRGILLGRRRDGTEFPIKASISKFEVEGTPILTVRLRDITERRQAEEVSQRLAAIVRSSDDAIIGKALDGTITAWNAGAERLYGYTAEEALGRHISFLVPPDHQGELRAILERILKGELIRNIETVHLRKDGVLRDVALTVSPIRDASGGVAGFAAIGRDITERKQLEVQRWQAQKMEAIGTLAGGIAHDFNNILAAITGYAELVVDDLPAGSRQRGPLEEILAAAARAKEVIRQILTFSQRSEPARRPIALQTVVAEALRLVRASIPTTVEIRQQVESGDAVVLADPTQLHQVVLNLAANAGHAMRERGGVLDVQLKAVDVDAEFAAEHLPLQPGRHVRLTVRDTGHGMPPQVQERIFDPFFTTKQPGEGTGLGLAVVHGIITGHGGAIVVESAPGRGTRFDIYLPCHAGALEEAATPEERPVRGHQERILIVDDEPALVRIWAAMLEKLGYRVTGSTSSREALETFRGNPQAFDLVITDQTMPNLTGEALAHEMLRLRPDLPIILCSGSNHALREAKGQGPGIRAVLLKPVARRELSSTIHQLLGEKAARLR